MYTDKCEITPMTYDRKTGAETKGTAFEVKARIEIKTVAAGRSNGFSDNYNGLYILPPSTDVKKGYLVRPVKINGVIVDEDEMKVTEVFRLGRGKPHHLEVRT